jgi:hypothetical protein
MECDLRYGSYGVAQCLSEQSVSLRPALVVPSQQSAENDTPPKPTTKAISAVVTSTTAESMDPFDATPISHRAVPMALPYISWRRSADAREQLGGPDSSARAAHDGREAQKSAPCAAIQSSRY